jgi:ABC-type multidrug transport system fused ATPase/permease subunit
MNQDSEWKFQVADNSWRFQLAEHPVRYAIVAGATLFTVVFFILRFMVGMSTVTVSTVSSALYILSAAIVFFVAQRIVGSYALSVNSKLRAIDTIVEVIERKAKTAWMGETLQELFKDMKVLIERTQQKNPQSMLSLVTVLFEYLDKETVTLLDGIIFIKSHPRFFDDGTERLADGDAALKGFKSFIVNSIKEQERGGLVDFAVAAQMLQDLNFDIAKREK